MGRWFIARHGETVFNAAGRMQGTALHTPLTRAGFAQAEAMGEALRARLGPRPKLDLWASDTGRALQTLAVIAEHLELDWHEALTDSRLAEIDVGAWGGRYYRDIAAEIGSVTEPNTGLLKSPPPDGESFEQVAARLQAWLDEHPLEEGDRLVVMHGVSSRVLRGLLAGAPERPGCGAPVAAPLPQGSVVCVEGGVETVIGLGSGDLGTSGTA
jgi:probable phosphoglycerate mutase